MSQRRRTDVVNSRNARTQRRSTLLRALETAISIAVSMTPLSLVAFSTLSGV